MMFVINNISELKIKKIFEYEIIRNIKRVCRSMI